MKLAYILSIVPSPDCVELVLNKEAQLAVVNDYEGLRDNPQLEVTTLATIQDVFVGGPDYKGAGFFDQGRLLNEPILLLHKGSASRTFFDDVHMVLVVSLALNWVASMYY